MPSITDRRGTTPIPPAISKSRRGWAGFSMPVFPAEVAPGPGLQVPAAVDAEAGDFGKSS